MKSTADTWPLIGYLIADAVYGARYVELVENVSSDVFSPANMTAIYEDNYRLLAAYFGETASTEALETLRTATDQLVAHVHERAAAAEAFLQEQTVD